MDLLLINIRNFLKKDDFVTDVLINKRKKENTVGSTIFRFVWYDVSEK